MSEFGKGLTYCLGLFLAHSERKCNTIYDHMTWFNAAADHFYDLEIPKNLPRNIKSRLKNLQNKSLSWRLGNPTKENKEWAIDEAKHLLLKIDKFYGVSVEKADWE